MQAIYFTAKNDVQYQDLPDPKPQQNQVIIEVKASGICHTDFEVLKANYGTGAFPLVPGHEYAGIVIDKGNNVKDIQIGDRVVVDPNIECGHCRSCLKGWAHLCSNLGAYGVTTNGGFSQYSLVDQKAILAIGDLEFGLAALAEPIGCVLNGVNAIYDNTINEALVFGAGPMGILFAQALRFKGITNISFVDKDPKRLQLAESFNFQTIEADSSDLSKLKQSMDLVVEATGVASVANSIVEYIANGGKGLFFGVCPSHEVINVSPFEIFRRQLRLAGSHSLNHNIKETLPILMNASESLQKIISHRLSLKEITKIFQTASPVGSLKVQAIFE